MANKKCEVHSLIRLRECEGVAPQYFNKIGVIVATEFANDTNRYTCYKVRCIEDGATGWHYRRQMTLLSTKEKNKLGLGHINANYKPLLKVSGKYREEYNKMIAVLKEDIEALEEEELHQYAMIYVLKVLSKSDKDKWDNVLRRFIYGDIYISFEDQKNMK